MAVPSRHSEAREKQSRPARGPYKRYLFDDNANIPKTTKWYRIMKDQKTQEESLNDDISLVNSSCSAVLDNDSDSDTDCTITNTIENDCDEESVDDLLGSIDEIESVSFSCVYIYQ